MPHIRAASRDADISGANYYGVVVNGVAASVTGSKVHGIGEIPLNGAQHGNAILYINGASGTISANQVYNFQKNGITVSGKAANGTDLSTVKTSATVQRNIVTGEGHIDYIAQNGIQISYGANATVKGNTVSGIYYTPDSNEACGLLLWEASRVTASNNDLYRQREEHLQRGHEQGGTSSHSSGSDAWAGISRGGPGLPASRGTALPPPPTHPPGTLARWTFRARLPAGFCSADRGCGPAGAGAAWPAPSGRCARSATSSWTRSRSSRGRRTSRCRHA